MSFVVIISRFAALANIIVYTTRAFITNSTNRTRLARVTSYPAVNITFFSRLIFGNVEEKVEKMLTLFRIDVLTDNNRISFGVRTFGSMAHRCDGAMYRVHLLWGSWWSIVWRTPSFCLVCSCRKKVASSCVSANEKSNTNCCTKRKLGNRPHGSLKSLTVSYIT